MRYLGRSSIMDWNTAVIEFVGSGVGVMPGMKQKPSGLQKWGRA
jgi:hypothetical protein